MELNDMMRQAELAGKLRELEAEERTKRALAKMGKKRAEKDAASRPADLPPLTPVIAAQNGVAAYPITEIITALKMTRTTAYRWKKSGKPVPSPLVGTNNHLIRIERGHGTYDPALDVVRRVRSVIRWAKNKLEREGYGITRACYAVSESLSTDLQDLTDFVDDNRSFLTEDEQLWRDSPTEYWKKQDAESDA